MATPKQKQTEVNPKLVSVFATEKNPHEITGKEMKVTEKMATILKEKGFAADSVAEAKRIVADKSSDKGNKEIQKLKEDLKYATELNSTLEKENDELKKTANK